MNIGPGVQRKKQRNLLLVSELPDLFQDFKRFGFHQQVGWPGTQHHRMEGQGLGFHQITKGPPQFVVRDRRG